MDPMIKRIPLPGSMETATISQYADDTSLFITEITSVTRILQLIHLYGNISGALINLERKNIWDVVAKMEREGRSTM